MPMETTIIADEYKHFFSWLYEYIPTGRKKVGRPRKRWREQCAWRGSKPGWFTRRSYCWRWWRKRKKTWASWCPGAGAYVCESLLRSMLHVTLMARGFLGWLLDILEIFILVGELQAVLIVTSHASSSKVPQMFKEMASLRRQKIVIIIVRGKASYLNMHSRTRL
jgi:hypothetical protein